MKKWGEYYNECKEAYGNSSTNIYDLTLHTNVDTELRFNSDYYNTISELETQLNQLFTDKSKYTVSANAFFVKDPFIFEKQFSNIIENYLRVHLEQNIFGCHIHCDHITLYKTPSGKENTPQPTNSWLWHIDNSPQEQIKVMIYLNDVGLENGPFEVLKHKTEPKGLKITPSRIDHSNWKGKKEWSFKYKNHIWNSTRIPTNLLGDFKKDLYIPHKIIGNKGHVTIFDNNIIHRGTIPPQEYRYAVVFQFKPINKKLDKVFKKEITGNGPYHPTFDKNPEFIWDSTKI